MSAMLTTEKAQLDSMTDREAVAYWNILQTPGLAVGDGRKRDRHISLMSQILNRRGIAHEAGKRTVVA